MNDPALDHDPDERFGDECDVSDSSPTSGGSDSFALDHALRMAQPRAQFIGSLPAGATLANGRIVVGRRIGGGAMGTVYEAIDESRPIAIKVLNRVQEQDVYRLKTEFRTLRELHHPNVLSVYELFRENDAWFFTMERIDGLPIHRYLDARRLHNPEMREEAALAELKATFLQLAHGVAAIHAAGLVHRDLKPHNVLVSKDDRLVIIDFGLVSEQFAGGVGQTVDNRVSGTFGYMSPEQARGAPATSASDCYALGAILRQLGASLTEAASRTSGTAHSTTEPTEASADAVQLSALCDRLCSEQPLQRPTAQELLSECHTWGNVQPATALHGSPSIVPEHFTGRESELSQLLNSYHEALRGNAPLVLVHGPCGIGKSLLVRKFIEVLAHESATVLDGRCSEWESVPYNGLDGVMDRLSRLLLRLPPEDSAYLIPRHAGAVMRLFPIMRRVPAFLEAAELAPPESAEPFALRRRAVAGVKDLFYRLAERFDIAIIIEDLQWADANTLQIISDLFGTADHPRLMLLLTARAEADFLSDLKSQIVVATRPEEIALGPLSTEAAHSLARALLPSSTSNGSTLERIVSESQGVPEAIVEFAHELSIAPDGHELTRLSQALLARVDRLSQPCRQLIELIATAVRPITLRIATTCGLTEIHESLRCLMNEHLVRSVALPNGERAFDTYREHLRKVVLHAMPERQIIAYHTTLAQALEKENSVEPEWLLAHYRGAGCDSLAQQYSIIVAEKALQMLAYDHAATMFMAALELTREDTDEWVDLSIRCAEALTKAGRGPEAAAAFVRAARYKPPQQQLALLNMAVEQWIRSGHIDQGVKLLRQTLAAVGLEWPETTAGALLRLIGRRIAIGIRGLHCTLQDEADAPPDLLQKLDALRPAQTVLGTFDYIRGAAFSAMALPLALKAREPRRLLVALASEAIFAVMLDGTGGDERCTRVQNQIERLSAHARSPIERAVPNFVRAMSAYWMGRWGEVVDLALQAEETLRENVAANLWEASLLRSVRHTVLLHDGRYDEIAQDLPDASSQAAMYDDQYTHIDLLRRTASLHLLRDEPTQASEVVGQICALRKKHGFVAQDHLIMSLVVALHLYLGDADRANNELHVRWAACRKMGMHRFPFVRLTVVGMEASCVISDSTLEAHVRSKALSRLAQAAGAEQVAWSDALKHAILGEKHACEGKIAKAATELTRASRAFALSGLAMRSALVEWRKNQLVSVSSSIPSVRNQIAAIQAPSHWARVAHALF